MRLVLDEGRNATSVARDLGVKPNSVQRWVQQARVARGDGKAGALTTAEKEELAQLQKENRTLRVERDILKKAAAFFAKEST